MMKLIDSHTHLYLDEFDDDREEVINRALDSGVAKCFLPNIDSSTITRMMNMRDEFPEVCYPMMGLHPTSVRDDFESELEIVEEWLEKEKFIAIGETGIDLYWDKTFRVQQEKAFERQLKLGLKYDLPVVIHARESFGEIFNVIDRVGVKGMRGVFHSFTGDAAHVKKIREYDFYFGINGIVTFKNSHLVEVVKEIPADRLLLETDSPFLAPVPKRGRRNESAYIRYVAGKVAEVLGTGEEEVARLTSENAMDLFKVKI